MATCPRCGGRLIVKDKYPACLCGFEDYGTPALSVADARARFLASLDAQERYAWQQHETYHQSYEVIAKQLGMPIKKVRAMITLIRERAKIVPHLVDLPMRRPMPRERSDLNGVKLKGKVLTCVLEGCEITFYVTPSDKRRYCSVACWNKSGRASRIRRRTGTLSGQKTAAKMRAKLKGAS